MIIHENHECTSLTTTGRKAGKNDRIEVFGECRMKINLIFSQRTNRDTLESKYYAHGL
jgi:hypothetical protein